ncbi:hypothetical protein [Oceanibacterium hippocampi]|uniref:Uncharacterized protein n=1 Tax=Oceanibacterium hippocampi TaxID=745714 RepID=A0A1Y5SFA9_9PROT|nr:hypothetical protein [Oceanibacterium hippocampi]SLN39371.1 hypothetical protein OCH7691_01641 [Oceanibacterium hippocampi]
MRFRISAFPSMLALITVLALGGAAQAGGDGGGRDPEEAIPYPGPFAPEPNQADKEPRSEIPTKKEFEEWTRDRTRTPHAIAEMMAQDALGL